MKFIAAGTAHIKRDNRVANHHTPLLIEAESQCEAEVIAMLALRKLYPPEEDWGGHFAQLQELDANQAITASNWGGIRITPKAK